MKYTLEIDLDILGYDLSQRCEVTYELDFFDDRVDNIHICSVYNVDGDNEVNFDLLEKKEQDTILDKIDEEILKTPPQEQEDNWNSNQYEQ